MSLLEVFVLVPLRGYLVEDELFFGSETSHQLGTRWVLAAAVSEVIVVDGEVEFVNTTEQIDEGLAQIVRAFSECFLAGEHFAFLA